MPMYQRVQTYQWVCHTRPWTYSDKPDMATLYNSSQAEHGEATCLAVLAQVMIEGQHRFPNLCTNLAVQVMTERNY